MAFDFKKEYKEFYMSPHETQNPDEFVTEICYPVKKK